MLCTKAIALLLLVFLGVRSACGENWPGWRGPRGDGTSHTLQPPTKWDGATGRNIFWKTNIPGEGHSSPIVWNDRVFVTACRLDDQQRILYCLDRKTGRPLWKRTVLAGRLESKHALNSYASSTPATDGESVFVSFLEPDADTVLAPNVGGERMIHPGQMVVAAFDFDGNQRWIVRPGGFLSAHGFCSNPLLYEDTVILNGDHDGSSYLVALNKVDGEIVWKTPRRHKTRSYSTPLLREIDGETQLVLSGSKCVASFDPRDGTPNWNVEGPTEQFVASVVYSENLFYVAAGFPTHHVMAIRPNGTGDVTDSHVAWHVTNAKCYVPSPVVVEKYLLVADDHGTANCYDAKTGKRLWRIRMGQHYSASLLAADGLVYFQADNGVTKVLRPGPKPDVIAENELGEHTYASPAMADGQLFIRGEKHLFCIAKP